MYNFDFFLHIHNLLHTKLRVDFWLQYLRVACQSLVLEFNLFKAWREEKLEDIQYSAQTIGLEHLLQTKFDSPTITITNNKIQNRLVVLAPSRFKSSSQIDFGGQTGEDLPRLAFGGGAVEDVQYHFTVNAPSGLQSQEQQMNAVLRKYVHAGFIWNYNYS